MNLPNRLIARRVGGREPEDLQDLAMGIQIVFPFLPVVIWSCVGGVHILIDPDGDQRRLVAERAPRGRWRGSSSNRTPH